MCIVCNVGYELADPCLEWHGKAREAMRKAADAFLAASAADRRYDSTHKAMVRLIREWNRLEQTREHAVSDNGTAEPT